MSDLDRASVLLDFWFGPAGSAERERSRDVWFAPDPAFDATCHQCFLADQQRAAAGGLAHWQAAPETCLALILLLDQVPRNLFRGSPLAYASDPLARQVARQALDAGFAPALPPVWCWFLYLPFEHSEDLADQAVSLRLHAALPEDEEKPQLLDYARRHYEIIARFGRFPHRNAILGRTNTAEEEVFLHQPDSSF
jgi:uncharacterized protein (DUF924 family)